MVMFPPAIFAHALDIPGRLWYHLGQSEIRKYDFRLYRRKGDDAMRPSPDPDTRLSSFRDASMEFDSVYGLLARSCGLSGTEYWALVLIREGVVTQREISEQLSLSRQTLNSAFKLLIKKGLIRLEPLEHDQRSKRAILTQAGARYVETTIARTRCLEEQAWQALTEEDQAALIRLTRQYSAALRCALRSQETQVDTCSSEDL